jgi:hypothetical protein
MSSYEFAPYRPFDDALAKAARSKFGYVGWRDAGTGHGSPIYFNPAGIEANTDPALNPANYRNVVNDFRLMRAGLMPWPNEQLRQQVYRAHGQPVPSQGQGLAQDVSGPILDAILAQLGGGAVPAPTAAPDQLPIAAQARPVHMHPLPPNVI